MTPSQQIIANIYPEMEKLITDFYLVAADAARDGGDTDREKCLRYMAEKKVFPNRANRSTNEWYWSAVIYSILFPTSDPVMYFHSTFEVAIEAFIQAWPKIKPKRQHEFNSGYVCVHCGLTKISVANFQLLCEAKSDQLKHPLVPGPNAEVDPYPEGEFRWVNGQLEPVNYPEDNPFR